MEETVRYQVGTGRADVTPDLSNGTQWMAGYTPNREATSVNDPLNTTVMIIDDGTSPMAIVSVDVLGLTAPDVQVIQDEITGRVPELEGRILVHATHNHEGPDTIGLWGGSGDTPFFAPRSRQYINQIARGSADAAQTAWNERQEVDVTVADLDSSILDDLAKDARPPEVRPSNIGLLVFSNESGVVGTLVNWANHPEVLGDENQAITADYVGWLNEEVEAQIGGRSLFVNGAIGGLLTSESADILPEYPRESFAKAEALGRQAGQRLVRQYQNPGAGDRVETFTTLPRLSYINREFYLPVNNRLFQTAEELNRIPTSFQDSDDIPLEERWRIDSSTDYVQTEVNYLDFGPFSFVTMGGELYPELLEGGVNSNLGIEPFNQSSKEIPLIKNPEWQSNDFNFFFGLTNDFLGYFIPQSQWDGGDSGEYGEEFSPAQDAGSIMSYNLHLAMAGYETGVYPDTLPAYLLEPERDRDLDDFSDGSDLLDNPIADLIFTSNPIADNLAPEGTTVEQDDLLNVRDTEVTSNYNPNLELQGQSPSVAEIARSTEDDLLMADSTVSDIYTPIEDI